ncbi:unnamed protein product [Orchesella dallaii]|uniref:Uncharacterized protein n=1 Tax=Orchesella dallaii TaxID=48710 RepID=A0ABP1QTH7_9HEXA
MGKVTSFIKKMENDTIYFLIIWLIAMFMTLAAGIIVIMYQVRCFPCQNNEVAVDLSIGHRQEFQPTQLDPKNMRTCMVCGEVMSTEEEGEIHASCHDVDVMCV